MRLEAGSGLTVVNRVRTEPAAGDAGQRGSINVRRRVDRPELEVSGTIPLGAPAVTRVVAVVNPTAVLCAGRQGRARVAGHRGHRAKPRTVTMWPRSSLRNGAPPFRVLHTTLSPTLREIGTVLMKVSQNQYGETLLKAIGAKQGGLGRRARAGRQRRPGIRGVERS